MFYNNEFFYFLIILYLTIFYWVLDVICRGTVEPEVNSMYVQK